MIFRRRRRHFKGKGWVLGVRADRISEDRWVVEWGDGDPMGGSSNTIRVLSNEQFQKEIVDQWEEIR